MRPCFSPSFFRVVCRLLRFWSLLCGFRRFPGSSLWVFGMGSSSGFAGDLGPFSGGDSLSVW